MRKNILPVLVLLVLVLVSARKGLAVEDHKATVFVGQDLAEYC
ncbi:MAG: hypothetical protein ACYS80_16640 [Planctomycetota bacterium]